MSNNASRKRAKVVAKVSAADRYDNVEKQRQALVGSSDKNRLALKAQNKLRDFLDRMTPAELTRYEHFRRSAFKHEAVKQLMLRTIKTTCGFLFVCLFVCLFVRSLLYCFLPSFRPKLGEHRCACQPYE